MTRVKRIFASLMNRAGYDAVPLHTIAVDVRQIRTLQYISRAYDRLMTVDGAIVECGVGKGRTFLYFSYLCGIDAKNRTIWGFDSFQGFPAPTDEDRSDRNPRKGEWSGTSTQDIEDMLVRAGISREFISEHTRLVPGFYPNSFSSYDKGPIALLHVDVDLYQSYKDVLEAFEPLVVSGGLILFDEYKNPAWPGATQAIDEYFGETTKNFVFDEEADRYYFVKG